MPNDKEYCPMCDSSSLQELQRQETLRDRQDNEFQIPNYEFTFCDDCEFEFLTAKQVRTNDRLLENARRHAVNLLDTDQIRRIRKKYTLRQEDASYIFGGGPSAFSKYERGYISQSTAMDRLLRVADKFPETVPFLASLAGKSAVVPTMRSIGKSAAVQIQFSDSTRIALRTMQQYALQKAADAANDDDRKVLES